MGGRNSSSAGMGGRGEARRSHTGEVKYGGSTGAVNTLPRTKPHQSV